MAISSKMILLFFKVFSTRIYSLLPFCNCRSTFSTPNDDVCVWEQKEVIGCQVRAVRRVLCGRPKGRWFEMVCRSSRCHGAHWSDFSCSFFEFLQRLQTYDRSRSCIISSRTAPMFYGTTTSSSERRARLNQLNQFFTVL